MSGRLSTHVLNLVSGKPAVGMGIDLIRIDGELQETVKQVVTNEDGRCDEPLLDVNEITAGTWMLNFHVADFFANEENPFLDVVSIRFNIASSDEPYHVPLLVTPWSYSTYRGS